MKKKPSRTIVIALIIASLVAFGCQLSPTPEPRRLARTEEAEETKEPAETEQPESNLTAEEFVDTYGIAAGFTGDPDMAVMAAHVSGERLIAMTTSDAAGEVQRVEGAIWLSPSGDAFVVYNGPDGLPARATFGGYVFLFSNYTSSSVDAAVISPDGAVDVVPDVPVDPEAIVQLQAHMSAGGVSAAPYHGLSLFKALKLTSFTITVAGCTAAVILSSGLAAPLCAAAIVSTIAMVIPDDPVISATSYALGTFGCALGDAGACVSLSLDAAADSIESSERTQEAHEAAIEQAEDQLEGEPTAGGSSRVEFPAPDVDFIAEALSGTPIQLMQNGSVTDETTFDDSGAFAFDDVESGDGYWLRYTGAVDDFVLLFFVVEPEYVPDFDGPTDRGQLDWPQVGSIICPGDGTCESGEPAYTFSVPENTAVQVYFTLQ